MSDERRRVLGLLGQGKITVDEAEQLLQAIGGEPGAQPAAPAAADGVKRKPQFPRIAVHKQGNEQREKDVTIRVPISIVRAGMRLGAIIPRFVDLLHDRLVVHDDADLPAPLELEPPQALAADERIPAIAPSRFIREAGRPGDPRGRAFTKRNPSSLRLNRSSARPSCRPRS